MLHNSSFVGFAQGTLVLMSDGQWKPIENIKEGESVLSFDPKDRELAFSPKKVTATFSTIIRECVEIKTEVATTVVGRDQLFFTSAHNWAKGYETKAVICYQKTPIKIESKTVKSGKWKIYDIEVEDNHSLIADGLLAHNKNKFADKVSKFNKIESSGKTDNKTVVNTPAIVKPAPVTPTRVPDIVPQPTIITQPALVRPVPSPVGNGTGLTRPAWPIKDGIQPVYSLPRQTPYPPENAYINKVDNITAGVGVITGNILTEDKSGTKFEENGKKKIKLSKGKIQDWKADVRAQEAEILALKASYVGVPGIDPTLFDDALNELKAIRKGFEPKKPIKRRPFVNKINDLNGTLAAIKAQIPNPIRVPVDPVDPPAEIPTDPINQVPDITITVNPTFNNNVNPGPTIYNNTTTTNNTTNNYNGPPVRRPTTPFVGCYPIVTRPPRKPPFIAPTPSSYSTDRVYESDVNAQYFIQAPAGNRYYYDPPNAPASAQLSWYRHYDPDRGQFYYDRVSSGSVGMQYSSNSVYTPPGGFGRPVRLGPMLRDWI